MTNLRHPLKHNLRDPSAVQRLDHVWREIEARRSAPVRRELLVTASAWSLATVLLVGGSAAWFGRHAVSGTVESPSVSTGPLLRADGGALAGLNGGTAGLHVSLSDRSRIELGAGARLAVRASTGTLFESELSEGKALFDVTPHGPRRWVIVAGDVQVQVLGTRFSVERHGQSVRVQVERGLVRVSGPRVPGGSQQLTASSDLLVAPAAPAQAAEPTPAPSAAPDGGAQSADEATADEAASRRRFEKALAAHDAAAAFAALGRRGFARAVDTATGVDALLVLSDVARAANQPRSAVLALSRIVEEHAQDARAGLAALSLGRLQLEQLSEPALAARSLARAVALGLPKGLEEDGQARLVEAYARAGETALARSAADGYRARFPNGRRRAAVDDWASARTP